MSTTSRDGGRRRWRRPSRWWARGRAGVGRLGSRVRQVPATLPARPARRPSTGLHTLDELLRAELLAEEERRQAVGPGQGTAGPAGRPDDAAGAAGGGAAGTSVGAATGPAAAGHGAAGAAAGAAAASSADGEHAAASREARTAARGAAAAARPEPAGEGRFGLPGRPLNRAHPFYVGFVGALGVLLAYGLVSLLGPLSGALTLLIVSLFLALGLDPVVRWLQDRGLPRPLAITAVFLGVIAVFSAMISAVIPPVVAQATQLASAVPGYVVDLQGALAGNETLNRLDEEYQVTERVSQELETRLASGETVTALFGGLFGAGRALVSGLFSALTVLVLTLYFLASLRSIKAAGYRLVPASRRTRVQLLGEEVSRRIGGYVIGQISIATINGLASYVVLSVIGIPFAAVLAFAVGLLGLIPLVGATIGAVLVVVVALFTSVASALFVAVYYVVYQQLENYVLAPRIFARTVSVPGAVTLVAALLGGSLLGILGALIAIPIAAGILLVVQEVVMPRQDRS